MYCPSCGQQLNDDVRFCSNCGTDIQKAKTAAHGASINLGQARYHCPLCDQNDKIEKVSAIVAQGTVSGTTQEWASDRNGGYWTTVPFTQVSELARKLTAPIKPQYSPSCWWAGLPFIINPLALAWFAPISRRMKVIMAMMILIVGCVSLSIMGLLYPNSAVGVGNSSARGVLSTVFGLSFCLLFPASYVVYFLGLNEETTSRKVQIEATEVPRWQRAMEKWAALYYCARDDCVFDPATKESASADKMFEMLYS